MRQNADILIRNITVYTQDEQRRVLPETDVAIREGKIAAIGKLSEEEWTAATVLDGTGKALFRYAKPTRAYFSIFAEGPWRRSEPH